MDIHLILFALAELGFHAKRWKRAAEWMQMSIGALLD